MFLLRNTGLHDSPCNLPVLSLGTLGAGSLGWRLDADEHYYEQKSTNTKQHTTTTQNTITKQSTRLLTNNITNKTQHNYQTHYY